MARAAAMFNTVYEAEGAVRALRGADFQDLTIITRNTSQRDVLLDDLVTRRRIPFDTTVETIEILERAPQSLIETLQADGVTEEQFAWYRQWLDDGYLLVMAHVTDADVPEATRIMTEHGGVLSGAPHDVMSAYPDRNETVESVESPEMPIEGRWRRRRAG